MVLSRLRDNQSPSSGLTAYLGLQWYPINFLLYAGGISALAAENYSNLATVMLAPIQKDLYLSSQPVIVPTVEGMLDVDRTKLFKSLPGHERHYVPRSEYMFKAIQPVLDDSLFLGRGYEQLFDRFEILLALVYADLRYKDGGSCWGPIGRFGWKTYRHHDGSNPYNEVVQQANTLKNDWPPIRAGLFGGSYERFADISGQYAELLSGLKWY